MRLPFAASLLAGATLSLLLLAASPANAQSEQPRSVVDKGPGEHLVFQPDEVKWRDGPASLEPGAEFAVLEGDPSKPGVFTLRLKMPDGYVIAPHWHPNVERVTVLSGTFRLGSGKELNKEDTQALEAGSYTAMPPKMEHYAVMEGETVVQLTSVGPWEINYVDPEDDPRKELAAAGATGKKR